MALEGRNLGGRIGQGAAQIYDTSGAINTYARTLAQQQAKRDAEAKDLADKLSKFSTKGLREIDKDNFYKVYDKWRTKSQEAFSERDKLTKFKKLSEAEKYRQEAQKYVADSEAKTQRDLAVGTKILGKPHFFSEEGKRLYNKSLTAPIYSKDDIVDYNTIPLGHDLSNVNDTFAKIDDQIMQNHARYQDDEGTNDGKGTITYRRIRVGDPNVQRDSFIAAYQSDDATKAFIQQSYPDLDWDGNEVQSAATAIQDILSKRPLVREEDPLRRSDPNYIRPAERERLNISKANLALRRATASGDGVSESDYPIERIELLSQPSYDSDNKLINTPLKKIILDKSVKVRSVAFPSTQIASAYSVSEGKTVRLDAKDDLKLARLAYTRTNAKDGRYELKAIVVDDSGEYILDEREVPIDIRKSVPYKTAKSALGAPPQGTKPQSGSYAPAVEKGIEAVMKKNGISREQAIQALKAAKKI